MKLKSIKLVASQIEFKNPLAYKASLIILLKNFAQPSSEILSSIDASTLTLIMEIIAMIHKNLSQDCSKEIYSCKNINLLSQSTYLVVRTLNLRSEKSIKLAALKCLSSIFQLERCIEADVTAERQAKFVLYQITPQVFAVLCKEFEQRGLHATKETIAVSTRISQRFSILR